MSAWKAGKVLWFDESSGKGVVIDDKDGETYYVHYSAIRTKQRFKTLEPERKVKFKVFDCNIWNAVKEIQHC